MNLTLVAIPVLFLLTILAITKKQRIWPIIMIMGITMLFGMVNGSQGRPGIPPAPFAFMFDNNQIVRILGSFLLVIIYNSRYKMTNISSGVLETLCVLPIVMLVYYIVSGIEGFSDGLLGVLVKISDIIGFYLLVHRLSKRDDFRRILLAGLAMMGAVFLLISLLGLLADPVNAFRAGRFRGIVFSVNWMGTYLALFLIPFFSQYLLNNKKIKIFWLIILLMTITLLILTGSRAAMITALISFVVFMWFIYKSKINASVSMQGVLGIFIFVVIGMSIIISLNPEWFTLAEARLGGNLDTRTLTFQAGWDIWFDDSPLIGMLDQNYGVESVYLTMLYVYGIIGFFILIIVFTRLILKAINISKYFKSLEGPVGIAILIGFIINCFFEGLYFGTMSAFNLIFYMGLGFLFSFPKKRLKLLIKSNI